MFKDQMLPEKSKQTQLVARVARRIISSNMDIPDIKKIRWTVRVVVSYNYFKNLYYHFFV
jgi:hypothetical protein